MIFLWIGIFVVMFIAHELGHYLAYRFFGKHPKIEINGFSLFIGDNVIWQLKGYQAAIVAIAGIASGLFPFFAMLHTMPFPMSYIMLLLYVVGTYFDLIIIFNGITKPFENLAE